MKFKNLGKNKYVAVYTSYHTEIQRGKEIQNLILHFENASAIKFYLYIKTKKKNFGAILDTRHSASISIY